jgi:hypothetical protein
MVIGLLDLVDSPTISHPKMDVSALLRMFRHCYWNKKLR